MLTTKHILLPIVFAFAITAFATPKTDSNTIKRAKAELALKGSKKKDFWSPYASTITPATKESIRPSESTPINLSLNFTAHKTAGISQLETGNSQYALDSINSGASFQIQSLWLLSKFKNKFRWGYWISAGLSHQDGQIESYQYFSTPSVRLSHWTVEGGIGLELFKRGSISTIAQIGIGHNSFYHSSRLSDLQYSSSYNFSSLDLSAYYKISSDYAVGVKLKNEFLLENTEFERKPLPLSLSFLAEFQ